MPTGDFYPPGPPFPMVSITVDHMRHQIVQAMAESSEQWQEELKRAIDRVCTPEYVGQVFEEAVRTNLKSAVESAVKDYMNYGEGYKLVSKEVMKRCKAQAKWLKQK